MARIMNVHHIDKASYLKGNADCVDPVEVVSMVDEMVMLRVVLLVLGVMVVAMVLLAVLGIVVLVTG
jgi:hypothetical protein